MKVGIFTFHKSINYGSNLQAYALQTYLLQQGYDVKIIDYVPDEQINMYAIYRKVKNMKDIIWNLISFADYRYLSRKRKKFIEFWKKYTLQKLPEYYTLDDIKEVAELYDVLVVGSDQIWNRTIQDFSPVFFLPFNVKYKFSYGASMGNITAINSFKLSEEELWTLKNYDAISVREICAKEKMVELGFSDTALVLDPTFLLSKEHWKKCAGDIPIQKKSYILLYSIEFYPDIIESAKKIKEKFKLPIYIVYTCKKAYKAMWLGMKRSKPCSPDEFLNLIRHSAYVVSSSFHGCAFSLIFEKQFWAVEHIEQGNIVYDDRIRTLLEPLRLSGRIVNTEDAKNAINCAEIDYELVNSLLEDRIANSKLFVETVLQSITRK